MEKIKLVHFSPSGTTQSVANALAEGMGREPVVLDLLRDPVEQPILFAADDVAAFVLPVFGGRLPALCVEQLRRLEADGTPAVAVVVFGNRAFDDALLELVDTLTEQGFTAFAAAAFVAQHSIFPEVAHGRPDEEDRRRIETFGRACAERLKDPGEMGTVQVDGKRPYVKPAGTGIQPTGDASCIACGACVEICPVHAIDASSPRKTDKKRCVCCTACIAACPQGARGFHIPLVYPAAAKAFARANAERKEPVAFL